MESVASTLRDARYHRPYESCGEDGCPCRSIATITPRWAPGIEPLKLNYRVCLSCVSKIAAEAQRSWDEWDRYMEWCEEYRP